MYLQALFLRYPIRLCGNTWHGEVSIKRCAVGTFDVPSVGGSACSIPVHYQSKPEIVPSRTCAEVFSCPLKNEPKSMSLECIPIYPKMASMDMYPPHPHSSNHPALLNIFRSDMKTRYFHSLKAVYKLLLFVLKSTVSTLAYQQTPALCTVYKTACGLAWF